uniref:Uncharacterized protein n=1 Tax=Caenorhabditis japonica TaxID=281687 RepID=A0A8R1J2A8_CAEJA
MTATVGCTSECYLHCVMCFLTWTNRRT